jgi:hypothetical protein
MLRSFAGAYRRDVNAAEGAGLGPDIDRTSLCYLKPLLPETLWHLKPLLPETDAGSPLWHPAGSAACRSLAAPARRAPRFW